MLIFVRESRPRWELLLVRVRPPVISCFLIQESIYFNGLILISYRFGSSDVDDGREIRQYLDTSAMLTG